MVPFELGPEKVLEMAQRDLARQLKAVLPGGDQQLKNFFAARKQSSSTFPSQMEELAGALEKGRFTTEQLSLAVWHARDIRRALMDAETYRVRIRAIVDSIQDDEQLTRFLDLLGAQRQRVPTTTEDHVLSLETMPLHLFEDFVKNIPASPAVTEEYLSSARERTGALIWEDYWETWKLLAPKARQEN